MTDLLEPEIKVKAKERPKKAKAKKVVTPPPSFKWAVRLYSKFGPQEVTLGVRYDTREEAEAHATDEYVCLRCNRVAVVRVEDTVYGQNRT